MSSSLALLLTLAIILSLHTTCRVQDINYTLDSVISSQNELLDSFNTLNEELYPETLESKIGGIESILCEYTKKVDNMTMSYMTLDEILKQMTGEAQERYSRGYR